jgi:hypothetical protein
MAIEANKTYTATIETTKGTMTAELVSNDFNSARGPGCHAQPALADGSGIARQ